MAKDVEHLFYVHISDLYILFSEMSIYEFCPFSNWITCLFLLLSFKGSLYILDITLLAEMCPAEAFLLVFGLFFFTILQGFSKGKSFFILMRFK